MIAIRTHSQCFKYGECLLSNGTSTGLIQYYQSKHINTYISSRPGNQPSSAHIRATMFSPGETPTNRAPARLFSRPGKHPPTAQITKRASARLYSRPGKHPLTAHLRSHTVWLPQGFGSLPNRLFGKPPTYLSSLLFPSLLLLVPC